MASILVQGQEQRTASVEFYRTRQQQSDMESKGQSRIGPPSHSRLRPPHRHQSPLNAVRTWLWANRWTA